MYYNLAEIKAVLCKDVAEKYGIQLKKVGNKLWGKLRKDESTPSFSINDVKNFWYDFGTAKGGSVIDLVMELEGIDKKEAIEWIAKEFRIDQEKNTEWKTGTLTDSQYKEIGIHPERATLNFKFDLNKHSISQLETWSKKYSMSVKQLSKSYPDIYNKMLNKISTPMIANIREIYKSSLKQLSEPNNRITDLFLKENIKNYALDINKKVDLLQRAIINTKVNYSNLKVNYEKDINNAIRIKQRSNNNTQSLNEDEIVKNKIVNTYDKLFNCKLIETFSMEQIRALKSLNFQVTKSENKYLSIESIKNAYEVLGKNLEDLQNRYKGQGKEGLEDLTRVKDLFDKCNKVIDGLREANLTQKNEIAKQNIAENTMQKHRELIQ